MPPALSSGQVYRFGLFEANVATKTLTRKGVRLKIQDQPFRVLCLLLGHPGEIVSREQLSQTLWPEGTYVDFDGSLNVTLKKLRAAIDDSPDNPVFIQTLPRQGYRFIAPVSVIGSDSEPPVSPSHREPLAGLDSATPEPVRKKAPPSWRPLWVIAAPLLVLILLAAWWLRLRNTPSLAARAPVIAVLPFSNEGAGAEFDYLQYAIGNDLVSDLISTRSVSVRPFASTKRYVSQPLDPAGVGKELRVTHVVAGSFLLENNKLHLNLELVDVARNQSVWADELTISPQQLIALHDQLAVRAAHGLLAAINIMGASPDEMPKARNEEAFNLFLHSLAIPLDPGPNLTAIKNLEQSVSLDAQYEPAWEELQWRYYIDYSYGKGGEAALTKCLEAARRAELLPNSSSNTVTIRVEQGDLDGAYKEAATLLRRRPEVGSFHYEMSYVLRYAGLLEEAGKECDTALALDPGYNLYRSCAIPFIFRGDYEHASRYIRLDENSGFAAKLRMLIALRTGNTAAALAESSAASQSGYRFADLARLYLTHASQAQLKKTAADLEADPMSARDPEVFYLNAAVLSFCGKGDSALRELHKAINGNHCSYPSMDWDPLFDRVRERPEFADLRQAGMKCQSRFLENRQNINDELQMSPAPQTH